MDEGTFVERVQAIRHKLYRVSCTLLASEADREDALSEAVLKAWCKLPTLRQIQYFDTWLIRILINECRTIQRKWARHTEPIPDALPAPEPQNQELHDALMRLPEKYRLIIELYYIEGYELKEIARALGLPVGTAMWRMAQARKLLRGLLEEVDI